VIKFVSDLRQVGGFLQALGFPPPIKPLKGMKWGAEDRFNGMPFRYQTPFEIVIMADQYCYKVIYII
jgi:hypothetical protein